MFKNQNETHLWIIQSNPLSLEKNTSNQANIVVNLRDSAIKNKVIKHILSLYVQNDLNDDDFELGKFGKPCLSKNKNQYNLDYNISHTFCDLNNENLNNENLNDESLSNQNLSNHNKSFYWVIAITQNAKIGLDIENDQRSLPLNIQNWLDLPNDLLDDQKNLILNSKSNSKLNSILIQPSLAAWTINEAFVKAIGCGLRERHIGKIIKNLGFHCVSTEDCYEYRSIQTKKWQFCLIHQKPLLIALARKSNVAFLNSSSDIRIFSPVFVISAKAGIQKPAQNINILF